MGSGRSMGIGIGRRRPSGIAIGECVFRSPGERRPGARWDRRYVVCPRCETLTARSAMRKDHTVPRQRPASGSGMLIPLKCPDCRTTDLVEATLKETTWAPIFQGDPRGAVLKVVRRCSCRIDCGTCGITRVSHTTGDFDKNCHTHGTDPDRLHRIEGIGVPS